MAEIYLDKLYQYWFWYNLLSVNSCEVLIKSSLNVLAQGAVIIEPTLVKVMAWHQFGDKSLVVYSTDAYMHHLA